MFLKQRQVERAFSSSFADLVEHAKKCPDFFADGYQARIMILLRNTISHPAADKKTFVSEEKSHEIMAFFSSFLGEIEMPEKEEVPQPQEAAPAPVLFLHQAMVASAGQRQLAELKETEASFALPARRQFTFNPAAKAFTPGSYY